MVRIATFNAENLFARYKFNSGTAPVGSDGFTVEHLAFDELDRVGATRLKALTIREANADIVCLQEIDSLPALDWFTSRYLGGLKYHHRLLIDGNDPRQIDVAILSRHPIESARSHRHEWSSETLLKTFSRDCLEVEFNVAGKPLWLCNNHNKSMSEGRKETKPRRDVQVRRIAEIFAAAQVNERYRGNLLVVGDLNDHLDGDEDALSSLRPLLNGTDLVNVVATRVSDPKLRFTHFFGGAKSEDRKYKQLDYLLVNKDLAEAPPNRNAVPVILRKGMGYRVTRYTCPRFPGIGSDQPKASDHALVSIDLELL